jgi:hypothetical protein
MILRSMKNNLYETVKLLVLVGCLTIASYLYTLPSLALTPIKLFDLSYEQCPAEIAEGSVTSGGVTKDANCFLITGKAENKTQKSVYDADVYGRIYDADNNNIMANRGRIGLIEAVPPGISDFQFRISISKDLPEPLQLKQFKASGFSTKIRQ